MNRAGEHDFDQASLWTEEYFSFPLLFRRDFVLGCLCGGVCD